MTYHLKMKYDGRTNVWTCVKKITFRSVRPRGKGNKGSPIINWGYLDVVSFLFSDWGSGVPAILMVCVCRGCGGVWS